MKLTTWLEQNKFSLGSEDACFLAEVMNEEGYSAECQNSDWSMWIGRDSVVKNTSAGTQVVRGELFGVSSYPTHCEVRDLSEENRGLTEEELYDAVSEALGCGTGSVILV